MAELATGAVTSLLGVIRTEALLLGGVQDDVQFIKEEMESMNSFLAHLARWEPPGGEHDEQVRTWMNQVRQLAQDCNNCIDLYLYRGNPDIHRARGGLRRYLWWVSWSLHKLIAQHRAAEQLRQLKDRARDVGERRLRYGVEVPQLSEAAAPPASYADDRDDDQEDGDDRLMVSTATDHSGRRRAFSEPRTPDDYVEAKLLEWAKSRTPNAKEAMSMVIVAPNTYRDVLTVVRKTLVGENFRGYHRVVQVDIPVVYQVYHDWVPLRATDVLYYMLRALKPSESQEQGQGTVQGEGAGGDLDSFDAYRRKIRIRWDKREVLGKIEASIEEMKIQDKLDKIIMRTDARAPLKKSDELLQLVAEQKKGMDQLDLGVMFQVLSKLPEWDGKNAMIIAKRLKAHMQEGEEDETTEDDSEQEVTKQQRAPIRLHETQYAHVLRRVFLKTSSSKPLQGQQQDISSDKQATKNTRTTMGEDQIKQMISDAKQEILRELQVGNRYGKNQATGEPCVLNQNTEAVFEETEQNSQKTGEPCVLNQNTEADFEETEQNSQNDFICKEMKEKMDTMKEVLREQLKIKGLVDKIKLCLEDECPLVILKIYKMMDVSMVEDIRYALSLLQCSADLLIVTTNTKGIKLAKEYCNPPGEPIYYSFAGLYLYYDTMLKHTSQLKTEDNYNPQIFREILEECEPHEFCMKIFTRALYVNPKRSNEELFKLHNDLQSLPKSVNLIAKKIFMFSYNDLRKEYKSCLLYLAIFPPGHKIRRSTLIARWVTEGLTLKEDWLSSMSQANRCFDALIYRCLVHPADIGATGKVQSCVVDKLLHGFITTIARKQHMVDTRLSNHLARHFSIFNDIQLRSSDKIDKFFQRLSETSQVSLLKVLDLEGSKCVGRKIQHYLKVICSKMLLLKYLSLRGTDITQLPNEINNLRELEVLDIRQTKVCENATVNLLLLKLKRLLAGQIDLNPAMSDTIVSVQIPHRIDKMVNIEALCNVKARSSKDLKEIGMLWQLRKLCVVVDDKDRHLKTLLQTISDLHECIHSLSITIPTGRREGTPSNVDLPAPNSSLLKHNPKCLESLRIRGITQTGHLLPLLTKDVNTLVKVTLSSTLLDQDGLNILTKLPKLRCVRLRQTACPERTLTFKRNDFKYLKYLLVEGSNLTNIIFEDGAACELEKMVLSFTGIESISGAGTLRKLEDLELKDNTYSRLLSSFDNAEKITKLTLRGILLKQGDIDMLAKKPNVRCLELLDKPCDASPNQIIFNKDDFPKLHHLNVDCSSITEIIFASGSAPKLEKIKWSSSTLLSYIHNLPRLKELEFNGDHIPNEVKEAIEKHDNKPNIKRCEPETQDQANVDEQEDDGYARFPFFWK